MILYSHFIRIRYILLPPQKEPLWYKTSLYLDIRQGIFRRGCLISLKLTGTVSSCISLLPLIYDTNSF